MRAGSRRPRPVLLLVLALALLAAACRAQDEPAGSPQPTEGTEEQTPADGAEESPADGGEVAFDVGVTEEPCPQAVNADNGCIYLGTISDLTEGPFAPLAVPITQAQEAFWRRVNEQGGIGGFDIDVTTYVRDNKYNPQVHNEVYQEIKPNVLALAQTLGSPTTAAIIDDMRASNIVAAPASWASAWDFEDVILESGANYCVESMNAIDWALENRGPIETVMAVHLPGDYGGDGAAGAAVGARENGLEFSALEQTPIAAGGTTTAAVEAIVSGSPDLVILTLTPRETAEIVGGAAARGYQGLFIGTSPTWNPALLQSPAAPALQGLYVQSGPWPTFDTDTPGHQAMREALGDVQGNDGYTSGWAWSYPLRAALEAAAERGDLTRQGLMDAIAELEDVDYEGMLPEGAGNFAAGANEGGAFRMNVFSEPNPESSAGVTLLTEEFYGGPTAEAFQFEGPCDQTVDF
jgi:ABC-type branched-subunit amino acid transport system substrate-binding protein